MCVGTWYWTHRRKLVFGLQVVQVGFQFRIALVLCLALEDHVVEPSAGRVHQPKEPTHFETKLRAHQGKISLSYGHRPGIASSPTWQLS